MAQSADSLLKGGMKTNKPRRIRKGEPGYGKKKFVVVASSGGKKKVIRFGDAKMANKLTAKYWSCFQWRAGSKVKG